MHRLIWERVFPHQSFSGKTPAEVYWGEEVAKMAA